jgi:hypothetical protein
MLGGLTGADVRQAQTNAASWLSRAQRPNGAFDDDDNEEWALIAARTLIAAGETATRTVS